MPIMTDTNNHNKACHAVTLMSRPTQNARLADLCSVDLLILDRHCREPPYHIVNVRLAALSTFFSRILSPSTHKGDVLGPNALNLGSPSQVPRQIYLSYLHATNG